MSITQLIQQQVTLALSTIYQQPFTEKDFQINQTKPEFEGDYTIVLFSLVKALKLSPDAIGNALGQYLVALPNQHFTAYNIIKGFLNIKWQMLFGSKFYRKIMQMFVLEKSL